MRSGLGALLILPLMVPLDAHAQEPSQIKPGDRIRVTAPRCGLQKADVRFRETATDSLLFAQGVADLSCHVSAVTRLEVYQGRRHWGPRSWIGAAVGGLIWSGLAAANSGGDWMWPWIPIPMAAGAGWGVGPKTRKWSAVGLGLGAAGAIAVGTSCEGMGCLAVLLPAGAGLIVAPTLGLLIGEDHWEEFPLPLDQLSVFVSRGSRLNLGISIPLRR